MNKKVPFFAKRFVAGVTIDEALIAVQHLNYQRINVSLDILGENVADLTEAQQATNDYIELCEKIYRNKLQSHISIKLTMLGLDIANEVAEQNLKTLLESAKKMNIFVRIDMEGSAYTQRTVDMFAKLRPQFDNVGIVLQAYLYRTEDDLARVLQLNGRVRLCKGAYKEPSSIAFQNMADIRKNYLQLAETLLNRGNYPAFATHDDALINSVKQLAIHKQRDPSTFEFQMLYGLRRKTWHLLIDQGYNIRIYVPFGDHWLPYFSRRLRERKENVMFVLSNLLKG